MAVRDDRADTRERVMQELSVIMADVLDRLVSRAEATGEGEALELLLETEAATRRVGRLISRRGEELPSRRAVWRTDVRSLDSCLGALGHLAAEVGDAELAVQLAAVQTCVDRLGEHVTSQRRRRRTAA